MHPFKNFYNQRNVLVTGGAGFIGSHIVEMLVELGAHVRVLDNLSTGSLDNLASVINNIEFVNGSVTDRATCDAALKNMQTVFHLAAMVSVPQSIEDPAGCHDNNMTGTLNILDACRLHNVQELAFSSSSAVYGPQEGACSENSPTNPTSPYGYTKLMGEWYCRQYAQLYSIGTVSLRYFNVFGPRQNPHGGYAAVVAKFRHQLANNLPLIIFGDGQQTRDFVPVSEVVHANLLLAMHAKKYPGDVFNIASGKTISLLELAEQLRSEFPTANSPIQFMPARAGDIIHSSADCKKYRQVSGSVD